MSNPFESSRRKIARAKEHFLNLHREIEKFTLVKPYERVIEPHPDEPDHTIHKIKMTKELPSSIADTTADLVQNLRNALDNAAYAVAVASGKVEPKFTAFPFAGSIAQMANSLGRSKDLPKEIQSLFCGFQPYLGGDDILWALNEICNGDKHKIVIPIGTGMVRVAGGIEVTGYFSMPEPHVWNRTKNEMNLSRWGLTRNSNTISSSVSLKRLTIFRSWTASQSLESLTSCAGKVERIVVCIEAESRRLGL